MFNFENISRKRLLLYTIIHWVFYSITCVIIPCTTILIKYNMVGDQTTDRKISMYGLIILIIFLFIGMKLLRQQVNKIALDSFMWKVRVRSFLELLFNCIVPVSVLFIVYLIKDNMELALSVISICTISILIGFIEDATFGLSVYRENMCMDNAQRDKEKDKRKRKL